MKRLERIAVTLWLAAFGLCGCTRTKEVHEREHVEQQATVQTATEQHIVEVRQEGPSDEVIYKFAPPAPEVVSAPSNAAAADSTSGTTGGERPARNRRWVQAAPPAAALQGGSIPDQLPPHGPLIEMDVMHQGPVTDTKTAEAKGASSAAVAAVTDAKLDEKQQTKTGPSFLFWLSVGAGVTVLLGAGIAIAWKLQPPWLKALIELVKKL